MSQDTPTAASAAATEATYTEVPPATSSPGSGAGDDCIASSATRSTLSRTNPGPGATRTPSRSDSVRDSHRRGAPADGVCRQTPTREGALLTSRHLIPTG